MDHLIPIRKIFSIIDSCQNITHLPACEKLSDRYTTIAKCKGVVNYTLIREILQIKIEEKRSELNLTNNFKGKIRRKKVKVEPFEKELIEQFAKI